MACEIFNVDEALKVFLSSPIKSCEKYGNGHINGTYLVVADKRYILQRINDSIFKDPVRLMENITKVTEHLKEKARVNGQDTERATLNIVKTKDGSSLYRDENGIWWRMYEFCEGTVSLEQVNSADDFYNCALAFGQFGGLLADFDAEALYEVIPNFHNTPSRYENLLIAIEKDCAGRKESVKKEISFAKERANFTNILEQAHEDGKLPLRVTHNDTKLNNILFDEKTGEAVCIVDLDTVMPGYSVNDFGDSIRFGANTASEDETDLSKVSLDLELFKTYADGFIKGCDGRLPKEELALLPIGAMMMTLECGMRFLTDYLNGDVYFRIEYPNHNLDRCRNQFKLFSDMEKKREQMQKIVNEAIEKHSI